FPGGRGRLRTGSCGIISATFLRAGLSLVCLLVTPAWLRKVLYMIQRFRQLALSAVLLPLALSCHAAGATLPSKVEQALKANKIPDNSLSVMTVPLGGQTGGL